MKKLILILPVLALSVVLSSMQAFAGGSLSGNGTVRFEACQSDNLLILSDSHPNTFNWPYRVEAPDYCIHIYPDVPEVYPESYSHDHEFYYTLPMPERMETDYYDEENYLAPLDDFEDGDKIHYQFSITGGHSDTSEMSRFLITDVLGDDLIFEKITEEDVESNDNESDSKQEESKSNSKQEKSKSGRTGKIPPAGFEDEVLTVYDVYESPFPDCDLSTLEGKAAAELYRRAIVGGYPDGEFKGDNEVNRAELAKFLLLARYEKVSNALNNGHFPDVLEGEWYVKFIVKAKEHGIISGYPDKTFRPANTVNTAEFLKMITLTFGLEKNMDFNYLDVNDEDWFAKYAGVAEYYDLFPERDKYLEPDSLLTRDEVVVAIYQYLANR